MSVEGEGRHERAPVRYSFHPRRVASRVDPVRVAKRRMIWAPQTWWGVGVGANPRVTTMAESLLQSGPHRSHPQKRVSAECQRPERLSTKPALPEAADLRRAP